MLRALLRRRLDAAERKLGASVDYLRYALEHDLAAVVKFGLFQPATQHRKRVPADVYHAARIAATLRLDCGECVQIEVDAARRAGVPSEVVRAILDGGHQSLRADVVAAVAFAGAVAGGAEPEEEARQRLHERFGDAGMVELSLAVVTAQVYPTMKRGLGFAKSCAVTQVRVDR
jgi:alkylhydroperoxidase family enzyme